MDGIERLTPAQHKEIRGLRYVQDLGPYTMGVIAMMTEDGVWPTGNEVDLTEAEG